MDSRIKELQRLIGDKETDLKAASGTLRESLRCVYLCVCGGGVALLCVLCCCVFCIAVCVHVNTTSTYTSPLHKTPPCTIHPSLYSPTHTHPHTHPPNPQPTPPPLVHRKLEAEKADALREASSLRTKLADKETELKRLKDNLQATIRGLEEDKSAATVEVNKLKKAIVALESEKNVALKEVARLKSELEIKETDLRVCV